MTTRENFLAAIAANPTDKVLRLVFSDWLDDEGNGKEAECQRDLAAGVARLKTRKVVDGKLVVSGDSVIKQYEEPVEPTKLPEEPKVVFSTS